MMPGVTGIEVCQQIKAHSKWQAVPIIMVTALNTREDLARCLQAGADDFIGKPVNAIELRARVHSMLRIKQQHDRIQSFTKLQRNTITLLSENLQALRSNLALSLPHELRTPLNGIMGAIALLIDDGIDEMDSESIHELLDLSYRSACRLETLTQRFVNYLALELASTALQDKTDDDVLMTDDASSSMFIAHIAQTIAAQNGNGLMIWFVCVDAIDVAVPQEHLDWIVSELVDNAFKFSQPTTAVTVRSESRDGRLHLWVTDQGQGMTHKQIASIGAFMQFERLAHEQQGAGLGLKIVQKAVELYSGRLLITSLYQQKTTVYLTLPLKSSNLQPEKLPPEAFETLVI